MDDLQLYWFPAVDHKKINRAFEKKEIINVPYFFLFILFYFSFKFDPQVHMSVKINSCFSITFCEKKSK